MSVPVLRITKRTRWDLASYCGYKTENPTWNERFEFIVFKFYVAGTWRLITLTMPGKNRTEATVPDDRPHFSAGRCRDSKAVSETLSLSIVRKEYVLTYRHCPVVSATIIHISFLRYVTRVSFAETKITRHHNPNDDTIGLLIDRISRKNVNLSLVGGVGGGEGGWHRLYTDLLRRILHGIRAVQDDDDGACARLVLVRSRACLAVAINLSAHTKGKCRSIRRNKSWLKPTTETGRPRCPLSVHLSRHMYSSCFGTRACNSSLPKIVRGRLRFYTLYAYAQIRALYERFGDCGKIDYIPRT